jgi:hypothetical protein
MADVVKLPEGKAKTEGDPSRIKAGDVAPFPGVNVKQLRTAMEFFKRTGRSHNPPSEKVGQDD